MVAQFTSTNSPSIFLRFFLSSKMCLASCDLPDPVGPMSKSGSFDARATCSMRSMSRLNVSLLVSMPDFRNESPSRCSF